MPDLPGLWSLSPLAGLVGVVVLTYFFLMTGRVITKSSHERELALERRRGDEWKETATIANEARAVSDNQNAKLIESQRISSHFFASLTPGRTPDSITLPPGGTDVGT